MAGEERAGAVERRLTPFVVAAAVATVPGVLLAASPVPALHGIGLALSWLVWLVFATEAGIMLAVSRDRRGWARSHKLELLVVCVSMPVLYKGAYVLGLVPLVVLVKLAKLVKVARVLRRRLHLRGARLVAVELVCAGAALAVVDLKLLEPDGRTPLDPLRGLVDGRLTGVDLGVVTYALVLLWALRRVRPGRVRSHRSG